MEKELFRKLLSGVMEVIDGKSKEGSNILSNLVNETHNEENLAIVFSGLYSLVKLARKHPHGTLKQQILKEDLQELKIPAAFIPDISAAVFSSSDIDPTENGPSLPRLSNLQWRLDVAISTSSLNRVLEPTINMEMCLSNGKIHNFEVPIAKFHELRYNVAALLKEMEDLETRNILKIQV
ncbi:unnamed protein product [Owenia fusiformis]|uniref:COMM domain-containing protein 5 n=1 Tax=Owenia fusiformis TaxID=6347 RepID=A0A8S4N8Z4_OWEFU|nr:unnamed protein product [Owenia fusiformis]